MADFHRELLQQMYQSVPANKRVAFLLEITETLPHEDRMRFERAVGSRAKSPPQATSTEQKTPIAQPAPQPMSASPQTPLPQTQAKQPQELHAFMNQSLEPTSKSQTYRELALLLLYLFLGLAALVGAGYAAGQVYYFFSSSLGF